ncbi:MAG: sporulation integral membrane protein YtvI [Syntrophomonadaceae bacterium]|jgi:sporulation integral membrane protein YtvI
MDPELQKSVKHLVRLAIVVLALMAIYLLFIYVFPILGNVLSVIPTLFMPFLVAVVLAVLIEPLVGFLERALHLKRSASVLVSLIISVGGFIYLIFLLISVMLKEMSGLYLLALSRSDQVIAKVMESFADFRLFYLNLALPPQLQKTLENNLQKGIEVLQSFLDDSLTGLAHFITILPDLGIFLIIATIATFFIMRDRALLRSFVLRLIPAAARSGSRDVISHLINALIGFFKAYSILISITAIITLVSLRILGIDYVLTLGLIIGLLDILPVLGPGTVFIPWIMWQFIAGNTRMGISLLVVYLIISVVRQVLEPQVIGDNIGLHPLATLVSLYAGLQLGGLKGMILGPVCVVVAIACYRAGLIDGFLWRNRIG